MVQRPRSLLDGGLAGPGLPTSASWSWTILLDMTDERAFYEAETFTNLDLGHDSWTEHMSDTFLKKKENQDPIIQQIILLSTYYLPSFGLGTEDSKVRDVVSTPGQFHPLDAFA